MTGHDLNLHTLTMQVIELKLGATSPSVVKAPCKANYPAIQLGTRSNDAIRTKCFNILGYRHADMELVRVGIRILCLFEVQDLPGAKFVVLLFDSIFSSATNKYGI